MQWTTHLACTVQRLCAVVLLMGPFAYGSLHWATSSGPVPTWASLWDIACLGLVFFGLLLLVDNVCTALGRAFHEK